MNKKVTLEKTAKSGATVRSCNSFNWASVKM